MTKLATFYLPMAAPYLTSDRPTVDSQNTGIEIGFIDLLDRSGNVVASWGVHAPRCTIGSALDASVRVQEGNLAPTHVLLIFGKKFTLLKAFAQPTRVAGRPVKEWLIDTSTTIDLGELTFVVHPFNSRPTSNVVRGERISEIASRMGAAAPQASDAPSIDRPPNPITPSIESRGGFQESQFQTPSPSHPFEKSNATHEVAPEVLGQIKENMESLTAAVAALQANSAQSILEVQSNTESVVLASTQKLMEGFADRWFSDMRRELSTLGSQQQESVSQLTQSLDNRLVSMEQRIETIGTSSSEEIRVLTNQISSLAKDQSDLRNSLSEMESSQREKPSLTRSETSLTSASLELVRRDRDFPVHVEEQSFPRSVESLSQPDSISPAYERRPEANRHARMDGSEWGTGSSNEFTGQSLPYYAANTSESELSADREFGQSFQPADEPELPYQKAPHAMQWDAPVDESSDQSYVELLRRLEKHQTEAEKRSESLLAPELPPEESVDSSSREHVRETGWGVRNNEQAPGDGQQAEISEFASADAQDSGYELLNRKTPGSPVLGESAEDLDYLRSLSADQNLEPESVDLRQLRAGLDSDAIGSRLERLLAEASVRRKIPQATENPLDRLQNQVPEVSAEAFPPMDSLQENRNARSPMVEQLLRHSTELPVEATPGLDAADTGERELQALYASLGLVRNPSKGAEERDQQVAVSPADDGGENYDQIDANQDFMRHGASEDVIESPRIAVEDGEVPHDLDGNRVGIGDSLEDESSNQAPSNYEDLGELQVQNGASAVSSSLSDNDGYAASNDDSNAEEESIEEYMQRLLQRVRSGPNSSPVSIAANNRKSSLPSIPKRVTELPKQSDDNSLSGISPSGLEVTPASAPLSRPFTSLPPRAANRAPEAKADLDALRELANSNARRAIKRSDKRRNSTDLLVNVAVCAFSLACGLALLVMNGFRINVTFVGMTSAFIVSILWGFDSVRTYLMILREQRDGIPMGMDTSE